MVAFGLKPIGPVLKELRQNKKLTLEQVHEATKIQTRIIAALEEGLPLQLSPVYIKSYIKIYARYLGMPQPEIDRYLQPIAQKEKKPTSSEIFVENETTQTIKVVRSQFFHNLSLQLKRFKPALITIAAIIACIVIIKMIPKKKTGLVRVFAVQKTVIQKEAPRRLPVRDVKPKEIIAPVEKPIISEEVKSTVIAPIVDILHLTIFADQDTWMQVKSDGQIRFKRILKKNTSETWNAKDKIELWIADAGNVRLELNGKILSAIGRKGQMLKSVLITKEGLTIKK